jgi:hypothetical protein
MFCPTEMLYVNGQVKKQKAAESVKKSAQKRTGDSDNVCEVVGEVVHVLLKDENKAKVNSGY